jgi:hypothetical protein
MRMPLTPNDLSFLAASAPRAGSGGGLVTRKGYRPRIRSRGMGPQFAREARAIAGCGAAGTSWTGSGRRGWLRRVVARVTAATKRTTPRAARTVPRRVGSRPAATQRSRRKAYGTLFGRLALRVGNGLDPLADLLRQTGGFVVTRPCMTKGFQATRPVRLPD